MVYQSRRIRRTRLRSWPVSSREQLPAPARFFSGRSRPVERVRSGRRSSHVLPSLLRRFHEGKVADEPEVVVWGTGEPRRELLHADDLAAACLLVMNQYDGDLPFNVGLGEDITIRELAGLVRDVVGYRGSLRFEEQARRDA